ncbi:bifunctional hydroxymethylpyrimidine kinase/phosphomethylpyrimidine kinase [Bacillus salitolerans]|uniref:Hydroxymethylpyrimidine/phosphomethylpyrimidine kinase n=1 Tax=Bacillus salitolerans TaxID=1437434 RepID=A0ABW4LY78_9BACI
MSAVKALSIAGSDSGGGAGIQADLKTFQELEVYGMSAVTAITAQNTLGVQGVYPMAVDAIVHQLQSIADDLTPQALKTGMLFSGELITAVANTIKKYSWKNIVVDPVMVAKGGASLLQEEAIDAMKKELIPLATVITPNIPEAEVLTGLRINSMEDRKKAATLLRNMGAHFIVIKGGHGEEETASDLVFDGTRYQIISSPRIQTKNTHGTGCTFSAAITAHLAKGIEPIEAIKLAKDFIHHAIQYDLKIGSGHGPTNHFAFKKYGVSTK